MQNILEAKNLRKYYGTGANQVRALDGVSLSVNRGNLWLWSGHPVPANPPFSTCWAAWTAPPPEKYLWKERISSP